MKYETFETIALTVLAVGGITICTILDGCAPARIPVARPCGGGAALACPINPIDCTRLMDQRDGAQLAGKILAGVGGVAALGTAPDAVPEGARWGIGAGAATAAAVGVAVIWYGERKSDEFELYCAVEETTEESSVVPDHVADAGKMIDAIAPSPFAADGGVE